MAIFKIDTDVVSNASTCISNLKSKAESIANSVNGYDTSANDTFYNISGAALVAKNSIKKDISDLSNKINNTATHLTDVVSKHDAAQNAIKTNFEEVDFGQSSSNSTGSDNNSSTNYSYVSAVSAVSGGYSGGSYGGSYGGSSEGSSSGGSSLSSQKLTEEALEKFKNGDITATEAVKDAMEWALKTANDSSHGYSQSTRWGNPNYDCSSFVISAYEAAGIPVKEAGATYTGDMRAAFLKCGFEWIPGNPNVNSLQPGDILLDENSHTEMYIGNGKNIGAHSNYDGVNGDSSGREICVNNYYSHPWDGVLRYVGKK